EHSNGNQIQGNKLGTDVSGTHALGSGWYGVYVGLTSTDNVIGGAEPGAGNVIAASFFDGVLLTGDSNRTRVQGNLIGTDITGTVALGNPVGLFIQSFDNLIGGTDVGAGNLISGNTGDGIQLYATSVVQGNRIGTDITGSRALPNGGNGVLVLDADNTIGAPVPGAGNLISGNMKAGIEINSNYSNIVVQGNFVGTDATGTLALGNAVGVEIAHGLNNLIGGTTGEARNVISGNK